MSAHHLIQEIFNIQQFKQLTGEISRLGKNQKLLVSKFPGSSISFFISGLSKIEKEIIVLLDSVQNVNELNVELYMMGLGSRTVAINELSNELLQEKLTAIAGIENKIVLVPYELLLINLPSPTDLQKNTDTLVAGSEMNYDELIQYLVELGFKREKYVENPGEFAVRGSIIDFWSYSEKSPVRLEFDGDLLESIRYFEAETQRSLVMIENVTLASSMSSGGDLKSTIFDYFNDPVTFLAEFDLIEFQKAHGKTSDLKVSFADLDSELISEIFEDLKPEETEANTYNVKTDPKRLDDLFEAGSRWIIETELVSRNECISLELHSSPSINSNFEFLFNTLRDYTSRGFVIYLTTENDIQSHRLEELLSDYNTELRDLIDTGKIRISELPIRKGFFVSDPKIMVLSDYEIFNKPYRTRISSKRNIKKSRYKDFASLKHGDYVVHENFGIGQYAGLHVIRIGNIEQESIKILYAEGGIVYVNLNYLSLVKKFSPKEGSVPVLSVLGSKEWKNTKKKVKARIAEAAKELITLYAARKASKGFSFGMDTIWQKELEASFFYEDTPDQSKVTEQVKQDMESRNPMDRLVCGDVGFGKTEIAVRAAFKAVSDNKQVCVLVPTTILAEQHFNTFNDRMSQFPVKVAVISRFQSKGEQKKIVEDLKEGKLDIIIGTHRVLSKDVEFKDLGLLIIDEEQRFGVMAKEKLRQLKSTVDTLTLTATPIPRTLNLSLLGARDLSIIATPPPNRQPIYTKVEIFDIMKIREWILDEVKRRGQIYFVHDRVQSIEKISSYLKRHIPEINIGIAHGQMKPIELENVIHGFMSKKYHVLISTKIIESGLDIPNANTIIINRADRFGLAELHQLRGRVGRSDRQAYAYLIVPSLEAITKKAVRRLQAIEEYTDLGEGFSISMRDLEIRGAGNLLGTEQSGVIDTVGFDLYLKMVDEAVEELKNTEFREIFKDLPLPKSRTEPKLDSYFEIGIPKDYMPDQADRLSYYSALFSIKEFEEIDEIKDEMADRFGKLPILVERLSLMAVLRFYASHALFERVVILRDKTSLILPKGENENFYRHKFAQMIEYISRKHPHDVNFRQEKDSLRLELKNRHVSPEKILDQISEFVKEIRDNVIDYEPAA